MPARHDILVGALDFPWRPWGSIEVWEDAITRSLRAQGVTTMLVSDHPHLFEVGGENYHTDFGAWAYERGHESDPWRTAVDPSWVGTPTVMPSAREAGRAHAYDRSRTWFRSEEDFPGPRTMAEAARWIRQEAPSPRPLLPDGRRVRSARAVRHAGAVRVDVRPGLGRADRDLAALPRRRGGQRPARRAHGPPHPGQLRLEADLHRPLVRPAARRAWPRPVWTDRRA